jgi:adenylate kinase family enzyme
MDGNYTGTIDVRLAHADTVILLNLPRWRCLCRVVARRIMYHGQTRPDMGSGCPEQLTWEFLRFIWHYPKRVPALKARLADLPDKHIIVLNSPTEVDAFLARISTTKQSGVQ